MEELSRYRLLRHIDKFKKKYPDQTLIIEMPNMSLSLRLGDVSVYKGIGGEIVVDDT